MVVNVITKTESQTIEYKESWRDENLKVISAFANTEGGKLIIGTDDKGNPVGTTEGNPVGIKNIKKLLEDIPNKIRDILGLTAKVSIQSKKGKDIIAIDIEPSFAPISYKGSFFIRSGSTNLELKGKDLSRFLTSKSGRDWDEFIEDRVTIDDIDLNTIEKYKEIAVKRLPFIKEKKNPVELLEKLNLIQDGKFKRAAVLLFSKNPKKFFTSAYIKIGKF